MTPTALPANHLANVVHGHTEGDGLVPLLPFPSVVLPFVLDRINTGYCDTLED